MRCSITVGTRGSKLALTQTNMVVDALKQLYSDLDINIKIIKTSGDLTLDKELNKIGGKGLFIEEIEDSLANNEIDFAVHSTKDLPHTLEEKFQIAVILKREYPGDVLIYRTDENSSYLPENPVIGSSSLRRMIQFKAIFPGCSFRSIRGNVDTRINKVANNEFDGIILAASGIKRLGWHPENESEFFNSILKKGTKI